MLTADIAVFSFLCYVFRGLKLLAGNIAAFVYIRNRVKAYIGGFLSSTSVYQKAAKLHSWVFRI